MKRIKFLTLAIVCCGLLFQSCKEDKLLTYTSKDGLLFTDRTFDFSSSKVTAYVLDGVEYKRTYSTARDRAVKTRNESFASTTEDFLRVYVPVTLLGGKQMHDREISVRVNQLPEDDGVPNAVEGQDYRIIKAVMPADSTYGAVFIEFYKDFLSETATPADPITGTPEIPARPQVKLELELLSNQNFEMIMNYAKAAKTGEDTISIRKMIIYCAIGMVEPPLWVTDAQEYYLGYFTGRKFAVLTTEVGVSDKYLNYSTEDRPSSTMLQATLPGASNIFKKYLRERAEVGDTIYEDVWYMDNGVRRRRHMHWGTDINNPPSDFLPAALP